MREARRRGMRRKRWGDGSKEWRRTETEGRVGTSEIGRKREGRKRNGENERNGEKERRGGKRVDIKRVDEM